MSQSPYTPPQSPYSSYGSNAGLNYAQPPQDLMAPARRAGVMMFIMAALTFLSALCCAGTGALLPQMMSQQPNTFRELQQQVPEATPQLLRTGFFVLAGFCVLLSAGIVVLGIFVRRGAKGAIITSIVLSSLGLLYFLYSTASGVVQATQIPGLRGVGVLCVGVLPLAFLALLLICLMQSLRSSAAARAMREAYAQQYWQYAYQQQLYQQNSGAATGFSQPSMLTPGISTPPIAPPVVYPPSIPPSLPPLDPPADSSRDSDDRPNLP